MTTLQKAAHTLLLCASTALLLPAAAQADSGDYSSWDSFKNLFSPQKANDPITPADQIKVPIPYTAPSADFDDGFNPALYNIWQEVTIDPATGAKCGDGSPYKIWVNRKPSTSNIQLSLAGGGACWDYGSCSRDMIQGGLENAFKATGEKDLKAILSSTPLNAGQLINQIMIVGGTGMLRQFDPWMDNRAQQWTKVYMPYCTGDVHIGLQTKVYEDPKGEGEPVVIHHVGALNMLQAGAWIRNNLESPNQVFGNGVSAGGIGVAALYHAVRKLVNVERGYMVDDAGPIWFAPQGADPHAAPSQFLHKYALESWGTSVAQPLADGTKRSLTDWYMDELPGFDKNNFGTLNSALAKRWSNDRLGFITTQEDFVLSSFSYRRYFEEAAVEDYDTRRTNTLNLWKTEVNTFADTIKGTPNYGYYLPATRKFLSGHVVSALPDSTADIQELGLTTDDFVDSVLSKGNEPVLQAKEEDFEADRSQFEPIGAITEWIFKLVGL